MLFRMIRGVLFHQRGKMLLIAFTIALGASLATGMLNVVLDVEDKVNQELKTYGANIIVKPKDSSLLSDIYDVGDGEQLNTAYLREDELGRLKTIFWAFNIVDFTPFLDTTVSLPDGNSIKMTGTWFNHHLDLPTGESLDAGIVGMRSWWDITSGRWLDEKDEDALSEIMVGTLLAQQEGWQIGDSVLVSASQGDREMTIAGIYDSGSDEDTEIYCALDTLQELSGRENKVASIEVSALTTPDNDLARRAARNPAALSSRDYETWYCTAYVSAICYQIQEVITGSIASAVRQVAEGEGAILDKTKLLMILITGLSLLGSALGISNLVTASVMERAQEIGLLKAIGARDHSITGVIMVEILITALIGTVAGYFLGINLPLLSVKTLRMIG